MGQLAGRVEGLKDAVTRLVDTQDSRDAKIVETLRPRFEGLEGRTSKVEAGLEEMKKRWWMLAGGLVVLSFVAKFAWDLLSPALS
jgi:hypothetical protein